LTETFNHTEQVEKVEDNHSKKQQKQNKHSNKKDKNPDETNPIPQSIHPLIDDIESILATQNQEILKLIPKEKLYTSIFTNYPELLVKT